MTMMNPVQESDYPDVMNNQISTFWANHKEGFLKGKLNKQLFWVSLTSPNHTKAIVIVNGRVESALKYQELYYHFYHLGYDIYSFDHRGQGLSDRVDENKQIGHVERFSYYVEDMATILGSFELHKYDKKFILAHSMGGAIATRYIQTHSKHGFNAAVLSAPMFGVNLSPMLKRIAPYWACFITHLSPKPFYLTENKEFRAKPFEANPLTSSRVRYEWFRDLFEQMPQLKLGGPSSRWVWQALMATKACFRNISRINIPITLLQASEDTIVCNQDQNRFMLSLSQHSPMSKLEVVQGSKHEILFEVDNTRTPALKAIDDFFNQC